MSADPLAEPPTSAVPGAACPSRGSPSLTRGAAGAS